MTLLAGRAVYAGGSAPPDSCAGVAGCVQRGYWEHVRITTNKLGWVEQNIPLKLNQSTEELYLFLICKG